MGEVASGGSVNFRNVMFNPHGHGTHTECLGHITEEIHPVDPLFRDQSAHFPCAVITVTPESRGDDLVIDEHALDELEVAGWPPALVVRTLPNHIPKTASQLVQFRPRILHCRLYASVGRVWCESHPVDLPSVDRMGWGATEAHHAFWGLPNDPRPGCTITELVYVPQNAPDGLYLLHLGVAPFVNDASPSRPVLFPLEA